MMTSVMATTRSQLRTSISSARGLFVAIIYKERGREKEREREREMLLGTPHEDK